MEDLKVVSTSTKHFTDKDYSDWTIELYIGRQLFIEQTGRHKMPFTSFTIEYHSTLTTGYPTFIILWEGNKKLWRVLLKYSVNPEEPAEITDEEEMYMEKLVNDQFGTNFFLQAKFEQNLKAIPRLLLRQIS